MRILSKGSKLPFVHNSVGWDEHTNFKDYDIVFVNVRKLEKTAHKYDHPYNDSEESPKLFSPEDVDTFLEEAGHMIVYLPESITLEMGSETTRPEGGRHQYGKRISDKDPYCEYDSLSWLPINNIVDNDESGSSVEILDDDWEWYFGNWFEWNKMIKFGDGTGYQQKNIAANSYGKIISPRVMNKYGEVQGSLSLLPFNESINYSYLVKNTLQNVFDIDVGIEGTAPPAWLSKYRLPNEDELENSIDKKEDQIEGLKEELETLTKFKRLLYETNTTLEEIVREALRKFGFTIDGEVPGKRDGILYTSEVNFVLEITGTTGGIKKSKARQLDDWVENAIAENPGQNISGLLIVNSEMETSPKERDISIEPNVRRYMESRGDYKVFTTVDLYELVKISLEEGIDKENIERIFYQEDTLVSLPDNLLE